MSRTTLKNNLPRRAQLEKLAARAVAKTALRVEVKWKEGIVEMGAVDTGDYLNSVQTDLEKPLQATVGSPVEHAPHVEYGTVHMQGRPAATVAGEDKEIERDFKRDLKKVLRPGR